MTLNQDYSRIK